MGTQTTKTKETKAQQAPPVKSADQLLAEAKEAYAKAAEEARHAEAIEGRRREVPTLHKRLDGLKAEVAAAEGFLAQLIERRDDYAGELASLPDPAIPGPREADPVRRRRRDLGDGIAAIEGYTSCVGTIADDLHATYPRSIPQAERRIEELREQRAKAERELAKARAEVADYERRRQLTQA